MRILKTILIMVICVFRQNTEAEIVSSSDIEVLLVTQSEIIKSLKNFVSVENKRLNFLEEYVVKWKKEHEKAAKNVPYYLGNPINAFKLIKRLTKDLEFVENILRNKTRLIKNETVMYPTKMDVVGAVEGLNRLQTIYDLDITHLANGIVNGSFYHTKQPFTETVAPMSSNDCYEIGIILYAKGHYLKSIGWLKEALIKYDKNTCNLCPFSDDDIISYIGKAYYIIGDLKPAIFWLKKKLALQPNHSNSESLEHFIQLLQHKYEKQQKENKNKYAHFNNFKEKFADKTETKLCLGANDIPQSLRKNLNCFYAYGPHPFLRLSRVKVEQIFKTPDVTMFHDVLSEKEMQVIQDLAKPKLSSNKSNQTNASVGYRNAEQVILEDNSSETVARLTRRASFLTGLSMDNSEPLKVINYGIGGIYEKHYDCNSKIKARLPFFMEHGDRIATIMFYLSEVPLGGATVFPKLRVGVFPKKGSALFWYNLLPSGDTDEDIIHEACPVLTGIKFIAIKWPHEGAQRHCRIWKTQKGLMTSKMYAQFTKNVNKFGNEKYGQIHAQKQAKQ